MSTETPPSATPRRSRGDLEMLFILILIICFIFGWLIGWSFTENGWTSDCTKLGAHVTAQGKVYECEPKR